MQTVTFKVSGMTCGGCSSSLEKKLAAEDGVSKAIASHDENTATVTYDPAIVGELRLVDVIEDAGFDCDHP